VNQQLTISIRCLVRQLVGQVGNSSPYTP